MLSPLLQSFAVLFRYVHLWVIWWSIWDLGGDLLIKSVVQSLWYVNLCQIHSIGSEPRLSWLTFQSCFPKLFSLCCLSSILFFSKELAFLVHQQTLPTSVIALLPQPSDRDREQEKERWDKEKRKASGFCPVIMDISFTEWRERFPSLITGSYKLLLLVWDSLEAGVPMSG